MGFYSFWSVTGSIVTKAVEFGSKILKPILNGITNIANVVKDTANVLSMVPVIGAVSSQVSAAANIISSVSSAGVDIIDVGERYVSKHAAREPAEPVVQMEPLENASVPQFVAPVPNGANTTPPSIVSPSGTLFSNSPQASPAVYNVIPRSSFPAASPLIAPLIPKDVAQSYPERRILKVRRPSARERSQPYQKDEVDDLTERMSFLNIGNNVPKTLKTGGDLFGGGGGLLKRRHELSGMPWLRV